MTRTAVADYKISGVSERRLRQSACILGSINYDSKNMSANNSVSAVLAYVDRELDSSLDRLFALLRIQSISTDPAYTADCRKAAEHVAAELGSLGFETSLRPTAGHPVVIGKSGNGASPTPRVLFYGHYDVQPVDPLDLWQTPPFEPRIAALENGRKIIVARGACDDK